MNLFNVFYAYSVMSYDLELSCPVLIIAISLSTQFVSIINDVQIISAYTDVILPLLSTQFVKRWRLLVINQCFIQSVQFCCTTAPITPLYGACGHVMFSNNRSVPPRGYRGGSPTAVLGLANLPSVGAIP